MPNVAGHIARYVLWVATRSGRKDPSAVVSDEEARDQVLVHEYIHKALADQPDATRATKRAVLRRAVDGLPNAARSQSLPYQPIQGPYSPSECAALVRLARNQPDNWRRRQLSAVLALGLGAGLDGQDQRRITPKNIHETTLDDGSTVLLVEVTGPRPRTVVVTHEYVDLLREALALHEEADRGEDTPIHGRLAERANVVGPVKEAAVTASGNDIELKAARLRSTWLVAAMSSRVPLGVLMKAAGLKSARSLADLLPYCPDPDPGDVAAVLAAINSDGGIQ